jgi:hypothetical protein
MFTNSVVVFYSPVTAAAAAGAGHSRRLRVTANPNITLSRAHVPWRCRWARVVLLGPLTLHDVDAGSFAHHEGVYQPAEQGAHCPALGSSGQPWS